jgi:lipoprotein-anchoring transpeptidase ErfK/SrfK
MEKTTKILILPLVMTFFFIETYSQNNEIIVDISEQRLYLYNNDNLVQSFPVSTSKYGEGQIENSFKTPLGLHEIKEKIGDQVPINTIFTARVNTNKVAEIQINPNDTEDDFVTSRILWLDGLENGINRGVGVDSYGRYIYIHGTHEEGLIGQKASHGCIRMFNNDVIELFDMVSEGTKVQIRA